MPETPPATPTTPRCECDSFSCPLSLPLDWLTYGKLSHFVMVHASCPNPVSSTVAYVGALTLTNGQSIKLYR